jgi:hypothetical protein
MPRKKGNPENESPEIDPSLYSEAMLLLEFRSSVVPAVLGWLEKQVGVIQVYGPNALEDDGLGWNIGVRVEANVAREVRDKAKRRKGFKHFSLIWNARSFGRAKMKR